MTVSERAIAAGLYKVEQVEAEKLAAYLVRVRIESEYLAVLCRRETTYATN